MNPMVIGLALIAAAVVMQQLMLPFMQWMINTQSFFHSLALDGLSPLSWENVTIGVVMAAIFVTLCAGIAMLAVSAFSSLAAFIDNGLLRFLSSPGVRRFTRIKIK